MGEILKISPQLKAKKSKYKYLCTHCEEWVELTYDGMMNRIRSNNETLPCSKCSPRVGDKIYDITAEQAKKTQKIGRSTRYLWLGLMEYSGKKLAFKSNKYIGCTHEFFVEHIMNQFDCNMSVENYGKYWNFDHIIPLRQAIEEGEESFLKACHYTNIRPLEIKENLKRRGRI